LVLLAILVRYFNSRKTRRGKNNLRWLLRAAFNKYTRIRMLCPVAGGNKRRCSWFEIISSFVVSILWALAFEGCLPIQSETAFDVEIPQVLDKRITVYRVPWIGFDPSAH
jgi:hypothetical protein